SVGDDITGHASYNIYDGIPATSVYCNLDPQAYGMMVTAIRGDLVSNFASSTGGSVCNQCAQVNANGNSVVVRIIDQSNDYTSDNGQRLLDMAPEAFSQIGDTNSGSISVDFQIIDCPSNLQ